MLALAKTVVRYRSLALSLAYLVGESDVQLFGRVATVAFTGRMNCVPKYFVFTVGLFSDTHIHIQTR